MSEKAPRTISDFWQEILKKVLSQSLLVIVGFSLFYYVLIKSQETSAAFIEQKDELITSLNKRMLQEHKENQVLLQAIHENSREHYEHRLEEQEEHYERIIDFYENKMGFIGKQYENR